jgi:hypothetical protein
MSGARGRARAYSKPLLTNLLIYAILFLGNWYIPTVAEYYPLLFQMALINRDCFLIVYFSIVAGEIEQKILTSLHSLAAWQSFRVSSDQ